MFDQIILASKSKIRKKILEKNEIKCILIFHMFNNVYKIKVLQEKIRIIRIIKNDKNNT